MFRSRWERSHVTLLQHMMFPTRCIAMSRGGSTKARIYGLRRSSLIMGVHPGCPVCSIVAASLVAVDTDVGETISTTKVAFVCGLWSVGVVSLLRAGPFCYFCIHQPLFPCLEVLVQNAFPHYAIGCKVLLVSLADILVAQLWVAFGSPSRRQLSTENVFWDAAIFHAVDMPEPTQPALSEQGEHAWKLSMNTEVLSLKLVESFKSLM